MGITHRPRHIDTDSLAKGPLGPYFDAFKQYLAQHGYPNLPGCYGRARRWRRQSVVGLVESVARVEQFDWP